MLRGSMDGNFEQVGETLRANPIPLALIGAGIGWLLLSRSGGTRGGGNETLDDRRAIEWEARHAGHAALRPDLPLRFGATLFATMR